MTIEHWQKVFMEYNTAKTKDQWLQDLSSIDAEIAQFETENNLSIQKVNEEPYLYGDTGRTAERLINKKLTICLALQAIWQKEAEAEKVVDLAEYRKLKARSL